MTRTRPAAVDTEAAKAITLPTWLMKIDYPAPIKLTSGLQATIGVDTFSRPGLRIERMTELALRFTCANDDNAFSAVLSSDGASDIPVTLWKYYVTDGVIVWTGFLDGARMAKKFVQFKATKVEAGKATFPERYFNRTDFPYLPNDGTVIRRGGVELMLRSR